MIAIYAAAAMFIQDLLMVGMVQAEARNRAVLAGFLDSAGWIATITTTTISVTALQGHKLSEKILVVSAVTCANFFGSYTGVKIGKRYIKEAI